MRSFFSLSNLAYSYLAAAKRFPLAVVTALAGTIACSSLLVLTEPGETFDLAFKILVTCTIGFPLFISGKTAQEAYNWNGWILNGITLVFLLLYAGFLAPTASHPVYNSVVTYIICLTVAHLTVSFASHFRPNNIEHFWEFNRQLFFHFAIGLFYTLILFGGLSLAILAVENLFNVKIHHESYAHLFIWLAGFFHTGYFLSNFPAQYHFDLSEIKYEKAIINLVKFILIPLVALYFIILYAYSIKILITWTLPKGWVSILIICFSVAGILSYLLNFMLPGISNSSIIRMYRRWFFLSLLPLTLLLFSAIMKRIGDYGVTEERYFVVVIGAWLFLLSLYFIISKKDDIRVIPVSLSIVGIISLLGPWSVFSISRNSQLNRLENLLTTEGILIDGTIKTKAPLLKNENAIEIQQVLQYLEERQYLYYLNQWFDISKEEIKENSSKVVTELLEKMGVEKTAFLPRQNSRHAYYHFQLEDKLSIEGYESFMHFTLSGEMREKGKEDHIIGLGTNGNTIFLKKGDAELGEFDLSSHLQSWEEKYTSDNKHQGKPEDFILYYNTGALKVMFVIENATVLNDENSKVIKHITGFVFWNELSQ